MFYYEVDGEIRLKLVDPIKDSEQLLAITNRSRNYLREWLGWVDATNTVHDFIRYEKMMAEQFAERKALSTLILYNGEAVGKMTINTINWSNKCAEIGYYLDEKFQGSGIMTRATKGMLDIAFEEFGVQKVEIRVAEKNQKSRQIPERLGFIKEGTIRNGECINGVYHHIVVYGLLAEEWLGQESETF
jgi:ribosomal-protein-serine acetyltransferase